MLYLQKVFTSKIIRHRGNQCILVNYRNLPFLKSTSYAISYFYFRKSSTKLRNVFFSDDFYSFFCTRCLKIKKSERFLLRCVHCKKQQQEKALKKLSGDFMEKKKLSALTQVKNCIFYGNSLYLLQISCYFNRFFFLLTLKIQFMYIK